MLSAEEQETVNTYNNIAPDWTATLSEDFWEAEYQKFLSYLPAGKILDVGCGSGRDSKWLSKYGYNVVGVDISPEMIRLAKLKSPNSQFFVQDFNKLVFAPASFNGFWAANSFLHIARKNILPVLDNIKNILKPGAVGFISIKEGSGEKMTQWRDSGQNRYFVYYTQHEFADILKQSGFGILETAKRPPVNGNQDGTFLLYYIKKI